MQPLPQIQVLTSDWPEYALLDSGRGRKLERFGSHIVSRGEPKAWWRPALPESEWAKAVAEHDDERGQWRFRGRAPGECPLRFEDVTLQARITEGSKHLGVFPEQAPHWRWLREKGRAQPRGTRRLLNLFGYTGAASLVAAAAGFQVTHVDASKPAITWARKNQELSGLGEAPIRWILDDALKFVRRELRRGVRYDAIALDPPSYGRGPNKEVWKVDEHLPELLEACRQVLSDSPLFVVMTLYSLEASSLMIANVLAEMTKGLSGAVSIGELALRHSGAGDARLLPLSLWGRWECR